MKKKQPGRFDYEDDPDLKIPPDLQLGLKWKNDDGVEYESKLSENHYLNGKRVARLTERSWVGTMAIEAIHYYGRIELGHPSGFHIDENGRESWSGGYMGKNAPDLWDISLNVVRRLTKVEKDGNDEVIGKVGDWTYRFNTPEEVRPAAINLFKRKFAPGWVLVGETEEGEKVVLCET